MKKRKPPAPAGLRGTHGGRLWRDVVAVYDLRADELRLLEDLCRHVDLVDRLEAEVAGGPLTVPGSKGQEVPHPLLAELRQSRLLVKQLVAQLDLPDGPARAEQKSGDVSLMARRAAAARWRRVDGRSGGAST